MSQSFGHYKPLHPRLGRLAYRLTQPLIQFISTQRGMVTLNHAYSQERLSTMRQKWARGEPIYLLGLGAGGHNAGAALVEVTPANGLRLLCNNEEERFTGLKHYADYPEQSINDVLGQLAQRHLTPRDIHACLVNWDYSELLAHSVRTFAEEFPHNLELLKPQPRTTFITDYQAILEAYSAPRRLSQQLGLSSPVPLINLRHHDNHAYFAYAVSPFAHSSQPVLVMVIDGSGDDGSISVYLAEQGQVRLIYDNGSMFDSLGTFYSMLSTTQGGWSPLSSEGRYMGAAAWGNGDRLTNPYYRQLRQLLYFATDGQIYLNRALANWHRGGYGKPYTPALSELLGQPILPHDFWQPDKVLQLDDIADKHPAATQAHVDKAAATQMVFEDGLFHLVSHFIRQTGSSQLILTGGTALNAVANMRLLEHFDETYYERYVNFSSKAHRFSKPVSFNHRLHLWIPPMPGDSGTPAGAAYHFAMRALPDVIQPNNILPHAFYCGLPPTSAQILAALQARPDMGYISLGQSTDMADLLAYIIAQNGVMGLFQGVAETGPRALGHRSILANPCSPHTRQWLNERVKYREIIRPLAPMLTLEAAQQFFELSSGAATANYNAYHYMVLTARAKPAAYHAIPAVIHHDGTGRLQIISPEHHPFTYRYLKALGHHLGVEVSVNTSLNVGSPIVQTPLQALTALQRSKGLSGLLFISEQEEAFLAWHNITAPPKDAGAQLRGWLEAFGVG